MILQPVRSDTNTNGDPLFSDSSLPPPLGWLIHDAHWCAQAPAILAERDLWNAAMRP
jgi:hypothetical protein